MNRLVRWTRQSGLVCGVVGIAALMSAPATALANGKMGGSSHTPMSNGSAESHHHSGGGGMKSHQGGSNHGSAGVGPNKLGLAIPNIMNGLTYVNLLDDPTGTHPRTYTPNSSSQPPIYEPGPGYTGGPEPLPPGYTPPVDQGELQRKLNALEAQNKRLEQKLQALENRLNGVPTPPDPTASRLNQKLQQIQNRNNQPTNLTPGWKWNPMDR